MRRDESGAIAIVVALFSVVLFGFAALVVDVGNASDVKAQASNAADAGALAGERAFAVWTNANGMVPDPLLEQVVEDAVNSTYPVSTAAWAACADTSIPADYAVSATTRCIQYRFILDGDRAVIGSTVRVRMPIRRVPSTLAGVVGIGSIAVSPVAGATAGQDPPSPCQACDPRLDPSGAPVTIKQLPGAIRAELPSLVPPGPPAPATPTFDAQGCPTGPGEFDADVTVAGPLPCILAPGLYVFNDSHLSVSGSLSNSSAPDGTGVTLVFYGTDPKPLDVDGSLTLVASPSNQAFVAGGPIPGVAIVIDQPPSAAGTTARTFDLGPRFDITGSVYALDGQTTWGNDAGECLAGGGCRIRDDGAVESLGVTATSFSSGMVPTVASDHAAPLAPPQSEHLSE